MVGKRLLYPTSGGGVPGDVAVQRAETPRSRAAGPVRSIRRRRIGRQAAALSDAAIRRPAPQAQGMSSSMREAGQRLTSLASTSAK